MSNAYGPRSAPDLPDDVVLSVQNVSKKFCRNLKRSMGYGLRDLGSGLLGIKPAPVSPTAGTGAGPDAGLRTDEFWSVRDVSFSLRRGEVLGLIGPNGCGKTTLLRILTGIFPPDHGEVAIRGRVGALIALGAGFHPLMTGLENIYLNGSILGIPRRTIERQLPEIVNFAEIGEFINAPVATYSSGMRVKLGFAIAVQMDPELLIIDEVLAVGDAGFRAKCMNRITEMLDRSAVIFVSHSMHLVSHVCSRIMLMSEGVIQYLGDDVGTGIERYLSNFPGPKRLSVGSGQVQVREVWIDTINTSSGAMSKRDESHVIPFGSDVRLTADIEVLTEISPFSIVVAVADLNANHVCALYSRADGFFVEGAVGSYRLAVDFTNHLSPGAYAVTVAIVARTEDPLRPGEIFTNCLNATTFLSTGSRVVSHVKVQLVGRWQIDTLGRSLT